MNLDHHDLTVNAVSRATEAKDILNSTAPQAVQTVQERCLFALANALTSIACSMAAVQVEQLK
ncbi:Uncharacterised protein [Mycobacteroides abscessus subsp. massiliense]|uniref:hypothetical protein n=1 Tax=Mycobacteroides TaxID=670516 RepID=UPI00092B5D15|nr:MULTISPECIES: hypothetical protein [Mycobacteroides]MBF9350645.1 hypothetical protein [Mycobacteroides chelonae]SHX43743.1 Uncharacterised protein [Mycobacteroides abscessus subsp. abscessus]SKP57978.1 Uncharacterised protein [Mycobacteroides abscessus subsp. massiliense]SLC89407.1 Uncharacterised protein [Mycobacteroides abscessus subsp. abscessus]